ncbi:MAG: aminotransferase class III-fold pyridoxal phosphate-dependent enzyme [Planctomycetes bacterium]|nr:aminotransferase class III-fold pyridoxal phosphate-dependent enzyme [Planctomycetota bacterium]
MAILREYPAYGRLPVDVERTEGTELVLRDGRRVLDLYGGHCVSAMGGSDPELGLVLADQWSKASFLSNLFEHAPRAAFLEAFGALLPDGEWRVFLSNSGSEANENALKLALAATKRTKVLCFTGAFHGRTAGAAAISDMSFDAFPRTPFDVVRVPWGDLAAARAACDAEVGAIALEPIQSIAGMRVPTPGFLEGLRALADERGAALLFDEVQTASGRTGAPFAAQTYGVLPDLITTAKGAAAGLPVGITVARAGLVEGLPGHLLGSTFGGGPTILAMAAAVARRVGDEAFLANVRASGEALASEARRGPVREVRGAGLLLGLVLDDRISGKAARDALLARGVLVGTSDDPQVLRLFPALTLTPAEARRFGDAFATL